MRVAVCAPQDAERLVAAMRTHPLGREAAIRDLPAILDTCRDRGFTLQVVGGRDGETRGIAHCAVVVDARTDDVVGIGSET